MSADTEKTFSHAAVIGRLQEDLGWDEFWPESRLRFEERLDEHHAELVGRLLSTTVRSDYEDRVLLFGVKEILDHHESRVRQAILEERKVGSFYEEASRLGELMDKLAQRYVAAAVPHGEGVTIEEAETYAEKVERYQEEVLSVVAADISATFERVSIKDKVDWYSGKFV